MKAVIFIATDKGYLRYTRALIRSININLDEHNAAAHPDQEKLGVDIRVIVQPDVTAADCRAMREDSSSCWLDIHRVNPKIFTRHPIAEGNANLFVKQSRYAIIAEEMGMYNACAVLDADQLVVSPNFFKLLRSVSHSSQLWGSNETYKWTFGDAYRDANGRPFFESPRWAAKFMCNVPLLFWPKAWQTVLDTYNRHSLRAHEVDREGQVTKPVGDLFLWNIAVELNNRRDDIRLLPMETLTGVHGTYVLPQTRLEKRGDGRWYTRSGDEVYTLHGRMADCEKWCQGYLKTAMHKADKLGIPLGTPDAARAILIALHQEWLRYAPATKN